MIKGYFINLEESQERKNKLIDNLRLFGLNKNYSRFNAIRGNSAEATKIGLKSGELGLWKSWINLLKHEIDNSEEEYELLHIIEDDVVMSDKTQNALSMINNRKQSFDILFTDMYINPNIHMQIGAETKQLMNENKMTVRKGIYTGCTSSAVIKRENIKKLYDLLTKYMNNGERKIPLDNYLYRQMHDGELNICTIVPFVTSIDLNYIQNSTIQETNFNNEAIIISRMVCSLLRRDLSYTKKPEDLYAQLGSYIQSLEKIKSNKPGAHARDFIDIASKYCFTNRLLKYKYEGRLINEPMNAQSESKSD